MTQSYLTVHGHFYQPPRENPWLEAIEQQDSAYPYHDWNERITQECYGANATSKIVDGENRILDIVNNYELMSFNIGPTLMSWLEQYSPYTYERIIKADTESQYAFSGHGNAIAQVYNHMIMPLANTNDKYTQTIWGIRDFAYRFGRKPEGIWLAETAVDDSTLEVLVNCGIKYTILSPFQALKVRKLNDKSWQDVSWGNIDPARAYRYFLKNNAEKYIDLFFYDGAISKSVAFDELLKDGNKFAKRLLDGISSVRDYSQLVNIGTDGESYGHHTKFGDMALSYVLKIRAEDEGFKITNYAEFLEKFPPEYESDIKPVSSWSCSHGVGRWMEDCGCSTGGHDGWNQKWRKPLRNALDYLRDAFITLYEEQSKPYFDNCWDVRNAYIDVILDRSELNVKKFLKTYLRPEVGDEGKVSAMKLLEMQRQAMLMYTSCGWFFSEISGIETTQIMKYAARAMQLASDFSTIDYETHFLDILSEAKSNIPEYKTGADVYNQFVRPAVVTSKQIVSLWAIASLHTKFPEITELYCYEIKRHNYQKISKGNTNLVIGRVEVKSNITLEESDMFFAILQYAGGDFHCAIREFSNIAEFNKIQKELVKTFMMEPLTEIIRQLDENFGKEYYTLKDIFIEERRKILHVVLKDKLEKFSSAYEQMYNEGKGSIYHLHNLGLSVPTEFKLAAGYTLGKAFNEALRGCETGIDDTVINIAAEYNAEAQRIDIELDKTYANTLFARHITHKVHDLAISPDLPRVENVLEILAYVDRLKLKVDISEAQSIYYDKIYHQIGDMLDNIEDSASIEETRKFIFSILKLGEKLNFNVVFYKNKMDPVRS